MHEVDGTGGGQKIVTRPEELTDIYKQLLAILSELETNAAPNIEKLTQLKFYTAGKAKETMKAFPKANERIQDLYDNYARASILVTDILETMMAADKAAAEKIIMKLRG